MVTVEGARAIRPVERDQRRPQKLCQRDVRRIVGGSIGAHPPDVVEKWVVRVSRKREFRQVGEGRFGARYGELAGCDKPPQRARSLKVDEMWGVQCLAPQSFSDPLGAVKGPV